MRIGNFELTVAFVLAGCSPSGDDASGSPSGDASRAGPALYACVGMALEAPFDLPVCEPRMKTCPQAFTGSGSGEPQQ